MLGESGTSMRSCSPWTKEHTEYDSPNYLWFRARYPRFVYVDRMAVAEASRGRGYARRLYADLTDSALAAGQTASFAR